MTNQRNQDKYHRIPLTEIVKPVHNYITKVNQWWLVDGDDALIFARTNSCQCNASKEVVEHVRGDRLLDVVFIPIAYIPRTF